MSDTHVREGAAYNKALSACIGPNRGFLRRPARGLKTVIGQQLAGRIGLLDRQFRKALISRNVVHSDISLTPNGLICLRVSARRVHWR
jgi:hypothetical protein